MSHLNIRYRAHAIFVLECIQPTKTRIKDSVLAHVGVSACTKMSSTAIARYTASVIGAGPTPVTPDTGPRIGIGHAILQLSRPRSVTGHKSLYYLQICAQPVTPVKAPSGPLIAIAEFEEAYRPMTRHTDPQFTSSLSQRFDRWPLFLSSLKPLRTVEINLRRNWLS